MMYRFSVTRTNTYNWRVSINSMALPADTQLVASVMLL